MIGMYILTFYRLSYIFLFSLSLSRINSTVETENNGGKGEM